MHTHQGCLTLGFAAGISPDAASLLQGLLTATPTGLPPASDNELADQSPTRHSIDSLSLLDAQGQTSTLTVRAIDGFGGEIDRVVLARTVK